MTEPGIDTSGRTLSKQTSRTRSTRIAQDCAGASRLEKRNSPDYLRSEALVHLIRKAFRGGDEVLGNTALAILLSRCEAILQNQIDDSLPRADELREEVVSAFSELLANDGMGERPDELDYYECRFNSAFRAFRIDVLRRETRWSDPLTDLPSQVDEQRPPDQEEYPCPPLLEVFRTPANQGSLFFLKEVLEAIDELPADERKALVLCNVLGYRAESIDPDEVTAATLCHCTGRTIRNRLARAEAKILKLMETICTPS